MAAIMEYTAEQLNYYRICYIVTDVLTEGLRTIFKQEWDNRYKATLGEWNDKSKNGMDFWNGESPRNRSRNANLLTTMTSGDRAEWDCTMLFYAILYSNCISGLSPTVKSNVDDLRIFRNEEFAHMPRGHLSSGDFQNAISKVNTAFHALGLATIKIREIQTQTSFPTEELRNVLKKVDSLQQEVTEKETKIQEKDKELHEKRSKLDEKDKELREKNKELQEKDKELQEKGKKLVEKETKLEEKENQRQTLEEQLQTDVLPFCILSPKPTHDVFPRRSEVDKITQHLIELRDGNNDSLSTLYLSGNPGSGKSQLARLVAKRFFGESEETSAAISFVMTLTAESSEALLESYISFARHCKCPEYAVTNIHSSKDLSIDKKIASLKAQISAKIGLYTSWLLVVDNVTSLSHVYNYLPGPGNQQWMGGQLLITTQDTESIPLESSSIQHISVSKGMLPDDASSLLRLLSGVIDDEMEKEIAHCLDYQPLTLASAAIYVRQVRESKIASNFGWTDYLKKIEKGQQYIVENILAKTNLSYPKTMTTVTTLALEKAMSSDRVIDHLFTFLTLCAPQPILKDIVVDYIMEVEKELDGEDEIGVKISRCPMLLFDEEESGVYIRVHRVIHYVVNSVIKKSAKDKQVKSLLRAASSFSRFKEQDSLVIGTKIVPHLVKVITVAEHLFSEEGLSQVAQIDIFTLQDYSNVFTTLGIMCREHSQYSAAETYFRAVLAIVKLRNPSDELRKIDIYTHLGLVHRQMGDLKQAKDFHERALNVRLEKLGPEHVAIAMSFNNLGLVHWQLGDLRQAKDCHERALDVRLKKLGPEHVDVAKSYNNLGIVHEQLGDLKQAKDCHERSLDVKLKKLGPEHVNVANSYDNLGLVHRKLGDLKQAKYFLERALDVRLKKLGPEHVDIAMSYNNLGLVHWQLSDLKQAKDCHERALDVRLKKLGPEHVHVANSHNNLGIVHEQLGNLKQAKDCHERSLDVKLKKLGPEHVDVANSYDNLGLVHRQLGDLQQAKDFLERALDVRLKKLGPEHVDIAMSYNNLGIVHEQLGDLKQAKDCHERSLDIKLKKLGPEHVDVANSYDNLGLVHRQLGDLKQAKDFHEQALHVRLKKLGPEHVDIAMSYNNLGLVHWQLGDLKQAKECHERALDVRLNKLGPEHVHVANSHNNLGIVHEQLGDLKQAKDCHERSLDIKLKKLGPERVDVASSYDNLGLVHRQLGDLKQAKDFHERALSDRLKKIGPEHVDIRMS
ncbi:uncharacterized protein LOC111347409 [Stylophora pistillata]|uniref:uncharacterized protein LOC111347409 n=1 Tax=Stylophora pistillata TaxID=50429 RepID=UPI000C0394C3|nr:uncharacterized protein LOC111347409 [Stylophora pistillata]